MIDHVKKLTFSALFVAMAYVLPFLTMNIPEIGQMLCPMHIPVILCGFICGWQWGLAVGFISPLLRSAIVHMPPIYPGAVGMVFELATYGLIAGLMYRALPKKLPFIYVDLVTAMVAGRLVWGAARLVMAGISKSSFGASAFIAGAVLEAVPGIIIQLVLIPAIVYALERAGLSLNRGGAKNKPGKKTEAASV